MNDLPSFPVDPGDRYPKLQFILFRQGRKFKMAACRGEAKGCNVQARQRKKLGPCPDCIVCEDENETLGDIWKRIQRGDA